MHCLSCNAEAQWLPNGQLWCPRCQTPLEVEASHGNSNDVAVRLVGLVLVVVGILGFLYFSGKFDKGLAPYGLNFGTCAQMYNSGPTWEAGEYVCGDDLPAGNYDIR